MPADATGPPEPSGRDHEAGKGAADTDTATTDGDWRTGLKRLVVDTRPLRIGSFRRLWASTIVTSVGSMLTVVAVPAQIYAVTGSSAYVGLAGLVALGPLLVFGLWGGSIADVVDRRRLLLATNACIALTSVLFCLHAVLGLRSVAVLLFLVGLQAACFGVHMPVGEASVPRLVPVSLLPAAYALSSTVVRLGQIVGPLLAGALIPVVGFGPLYLIDAVALCVALWAVWRLPPLPPRGGVVQRAGFRHVIEGFRYMAKVRVVLVVLLADLIATVLGWPYALIPQLSQETFGDPPGGGFALGMLYAASAIGGLLAGLVSGSFTRIRRHGVMVTAAVSAWGLMLVGFGLSRRLWLAVLLFSLAGVALLVLSVFRRAIVQTASTDEMRGRVQGATLVITIGGPAIANFLHGMAGAAVGTTWSISGGGILVVVVMGAIAVAFPTFWRYRAPVPASSSA